MLGVAERAGTGGGPTCLFFQGCESSGHGVGDGVLKNAGEESGVPRGGRVPGDAGTSGRAVLGIHTGKAGLEKSLIKLERRSIVLWIVDGFWGWKVLLLGTLCCQ